MKMDRKKFVKDASKFLNKSVSLNFGFVFLIVVVSVMVSGVVFYCLGHSEGYGQKSREVVELENVEVQEDLMELPLDVLWEFFLKYLIVKSMFWLPIILCVLGLGWVLHGIF